MSVSAGSPASAPMSGPMSVSAGSPASAPMSGPAGSPASGPAGRPMIFGGTTEGRILCETCAALGLPVLYCVATADGALPVAGLSRADVRPSRLSSAEMAALMEQEKPPLVLDATHPYAREAGRNIAEACRLAGIPLLRVLRENTEEQAGLLSFQGPEDLLPWLEKETGNIFAAVGTSYAKALARLPDYRGRVWMRVLPSLDSLRACLDLGYPPGHLICMQGPFSEEMNRAMFQSAKADILVTKNSGAAGGYPEKIRAAQSLGMRTAVLAKPEEAEGLSLDEACRRLKELCL